MDLDVLPAAAVDAAVLGKAGEMAKATLTDMLLVSVGAIGGSILVEKTALARQSPALGGFVEIVLGGLIAALAGNRSRGLALVGIGVGADGLRRFITYII